MRVLTLLSLTAVVMPFVVAITHLLTDLPLFINLSGSGIFQGYWHNSCNEDVSYNGDSATAACIQLRRVKMPFNVIAVAYMQSVSVGSIPTFTINPETGMNESNFAEQVIELNTREDKTAVIISLGGPNSNIFLRSGQEDHLAEEFIRLAQTYGFNGAEANLERSVVEFADNAHVITTALRVVKYYFDHNRQFTYYDHNPSFIIAMAVQVSFRCDEKYRPYLDGIEYDVDYITIKFFDYDEDDERMMTNVAKDVLAGRQDASLAILPNKKKYLMLLPHAYAVMNDCYNIPNHVLVHGTLVNSFAGGRRKTLMERVVISLFIQARKHKPMRGVALWSINWDQAKYSNGERVGHFSTDLIDYIETYSLVERWPKRREQYQSSFA